MVINTRYRFVFVHVPKSGGTSVAAALGGLPGDNARWLSKHSKHETLGEFQQRWRRRRRASDLVFSRSPVTFRSFGFVRHPWERLCSLYHYMKERRPRPEIDRVRSFSEFIKCAAGGEPWLQGLHSMRPQRDYFQVGNNGRIGTDFVGHFEHLERDFAHIVRLLGLSPTALPRRNVSSNARIDYRTQYNNSMIEAVASLFHEDIDAFGYEYSRLTPARRMSGLVDGLVAA